MNVLLFLNSKYKSITSSKIVRELELSLNNSVLPRSLMRILGLNTSKIGKTGGIYELSVIYQFNLDVKCFGCPNYTGK